MAVKDYGGKQPIVGSVSTSNSDGNFIVTVTMEYAGRDGESGLEYKVVAGSSTKIGSSNVTTFTSSDITPGTTPAISVTVTSQSGVASEIYNPISLSAFLA